MNIWRVEVQVEKPKEAMKFIASTRRELEPAYSPDGTKIAFASWRSGSLEIWVCDSDGSHPVQLTFNSTSNRPRWSPDGKLITFYSEGKGNSDIYVIRADGGVPRQLTTDPSTDGDPEWSADGKWIYFNSDRTRQQEIWKVPVGGGEAVRLQIRSGQAAVESHDGKFLYYGKGWPNEFSLWRVPTSGGTETLVVDSLHPEGGQVIVDQGIYFISKPDEKGVSSIRFKDFATGSIRTIVPIEGRRVVWGLSVSPDRHSFLYTHLELGSSDLMLVENFR
jgi:Tol biopolymer transport system component